MKKCCSFQVPKPFVIHSNKALKRNGYVKYIIYPDLSRFKKACLNCRFREARNNRSYCLLGDKDFMLKFYGIIERMPKGILLSIGAIPLYLKPYCLSVDIEAYFSRHTKKSKR